MNSKSSTSKGVALIPARSGSKRIKDKNVRVLGKHPVIAYTIRAAIDSGVFSSVVVSTDSEKYAEIARYYGADTPFLRNASIAASTSPDIEWVVQALTFLKEQGQDYDCFSILRPTSPFRLASTIQRAWTLFHEQEGVDSLRAVEKVSQHPAKMWVVRGKRMMPLLPFGPKKQPWHSSQSCTLPEVYVQNASLEIAWCKEALDNHSIAGNVVVPFISEGFEGFDINEPIDWWYAEHLLATGETELPDVSIASFGTVI